MRKYTLRFQSTDGTLHSYHDAFAAREDIEPRYTHRMGVLADGTATKLCECVGPPETVREAIESVDRTIDVIVSDRDPTYYYKHFEPTPVEREMMEARRETELVLKMPIEVRSDGSMVATYVGDQREVASTVELVPDSVEAEVLNIGQDVSDGGDHFSALTDRQREVLDVAVDLGYYDEPRQATQSDVAAELGVSETTVGEHLRKIEQRVFTAVAR